MVWLTHTSEKRDLFLLMKITGSGIVVHPCSPRTWGTDLGFKASVGYMARSRVPSSLGNLANPSLKETKAGGRDVTQLVAYLPSIKEALSSTLSTA